MREIYSHETFQNIDDIEEIDTIILLMFHIGPHAFQGVRDWDCKQLQQYIRLFAGV